MEERIGAYRGMCEQLNVALIAINIVTTKPVLNDVLHIHHDGLVRRYRFTFRKALDLMKGCLSACNVNCEDDSNMLICTAHREGVISDIESWKRGLGIYLETENASELNHLKIIAIDIADIHRNVLSKFVVEIEKYINK